MNDKFKVIQQLHKANYMNQKLMAKNEELIQLQAKNEEDITANMLALTEVFEMVLGFVETYEAYGLKDTVEVVQITSKMSNVYALLIKKGLKTIEDVPESLQDEVKSLLNME